MSTKAKEVVANIKQPVVSIYGKLMQARIEFHEIDIQKTGLNRFSNYSYFELSDFLLYALKCMGNQGLIPIISFSIVAWFVLRWL